MPDPIGATVLTTVASSVVEQASQKALGALERARAYATDDARAVSSYLDAVYQAMVGLEGEYDRLLLAAKSCDLHDPGEVGAAVRQIDAYLMGENLRPLLARAVAGLRECRESLQGFADRFLQTPSRRADRQEALRALGTLMWDLEDFLRALEAKDTHQDEVEVSGVGVVSLLEIRHQLERVRTGRGIVRSGVETDDGASLLRVVNEAQKNRWRNRYLDRIASLETVARRVIQEFR